MVVMEDKAHCEEKFYWNHIYDRTLSIQRVPVLRLHSARIQPVLLEMMFRVGQIHRHNSHQNYLQKSVVYTFTGGLRGKNDSEGQHINDGSSRLSVFMLYFAETVKLLVMDSLEEGPFLQPDTSEGKMFVFLATIQTAHCLRD
jgi:hypothetical protein